MKNVIVFVLVLLNVVCFAQFDCSKLNFIGIYKNNVNSDQLSLLLTIDGGESKGGGSVYTSIALINDQGDTILNSPALFTLPMNSSDTIVFNVPVSKRFGNTSNLPSYSCGHLITRFPDCNLEFCFDSLSTHDLPRAKVLNCDDFKLAGLFPTHHRNGLNFSVLIANINQDSISSGLTAYTGFQFYNELGEPLTDMTSPGYLLPSTNDTVIVHFLFYDTLRAQNVVLRSKNPGCDLYYKFRGLTTVENSILDDILLFPNPAKSFFRVSANEDVVQICLYRLDGARLCSEQRGYMDLSDIGPGIYIVEIAMPQYRVLKKLVRF